MTPDPPAPPPATRSGTNWRAWVALIWAVVFATAPGTVTLYTADNVQQTFQVQAGVNKLQTDLTPGGYMRGVLERNGQTVIDFRPQGYNFTANPSTYNYNAFTAFTSSSSSTPSSN